MTLDVIPNSQAIKRQSDQWRSDPRDGEYLLRRWAGDTVRKKFVSEKEKLLQILESFIVSRPDLEQLATTCDEAYRRQVFNFDQDVTLPEPDRLILLDRTRRKELDALLTSQGIAHFGKIAGVSMAQYGLDALFARQDGPHSWQDDDTVAHERLHSFGKGVILPDMHDYGYVRGYHMWAASTKAERGLVSEEGMAVLKSFEQLVGQSYQEHGRASFAQMKLDIGVNGDVPIPYTQEYMVWFDKYLAHVYSDKSPYYWAGRLVGELVTKAGQTSRVDQNDLAGLLMTARVEKRYLRSLVDAVNLVSGKPDFARRWFGARLGEGEKHMEELKRLNEMVAVS